jgi:integrase
VSELCAVKFGHLETKWVDDDIGMAWTLRVKGKGHKTRLVPMPSKVMEALVRYLGARGLPTESTYWEGETPIIAGLSRSGQHDAQAITPLGLAKAFRRLFTQAAGHLQQGDPKGAKRLEDATTHWLRHTYGTHMIEAGMPLDIVQDNMGHASPATTSRYVTTELDRRIRAAEAFLKR